MRVFDFLIRFLFFAVMPFVVIETATVLPVTGLLINVALSLAVFVFAEAVRERVRRWPLVGRVVKQQLAFEAYYREHPPRPFLYYCVYPLLFPYWLWNREARREFQMYRGFTGGSLVVMTLVAANDFVRHWRPELSFGTFASMWVALFVVQALFLFTFLLPIATTVVSYHLSARATALRVLLATAVASMALAGVAMARHKGPIVSSVTRNRLRMRTEAAPDRASAAQLAAIRDAWGSVSELAECTRADGLVEGRTLERAQVRLASFYKEDEASAFTLRALPPGAPEVVVLQAEQGRGRAPVWKAIRKNGQEVKEPSELPPGMVGDDQGVAAGKSAPPKSPAAAAPKPARTTAPSAKRN